MKIALLGYGRMGRAIENIAKNRGHEIVAKIDKDQIEGTLEHANVAINFSIPDAAVNNIFSALSLKIPVVCGTTGWLEDLKKVTDFTTKNDTAFLYASNFSIGVNLFFKLNEQLAKMMNNQSEYKVNIEEIHHIHKLDAPSGTAITLAEGIIENSKSSDWSLSTDKSDEIQIDAIREGEVPGTHTVTYESSIDAISIKHEAHNREGFALGAVVAAEWIVGKKGIFKMNDVLNLS
ncbi:4-hydroxy-tetrahydrodipicolinate reductase [Flavobacteriaceae bacterium]|nr:4-hydroxy-tetrahydrodipicolinate reductase [Flavobacteriaceae bacterium]